MVTGSETLRTELKLLALKGPIRPAADDSLEYFFHCFFFFFFFFFREKKLDISGESQRIHMKHQTLF